MNAQHYAQPQDIAVFILYPMHLQACTVPLALRSQFIKNLISVFHN
jgi:hypothetical protein